MRVLRLRALLQAGAPDGEDAAACLRAGADALLVSDRPGRAAGWRARLGPPATGGPALVVALDPVSGSGGADRLPDLLRARPDAVLARLGDRSGIQELSVALAVAEAELGLPAGQVGILAAVADPAAAFRLAEMRGASARLRALVWSGPPPGRSATDPAATFRALLLLAAAAAGVPALDAGLPDDAAAARHWRRAARDGFSGALAGSPRDVETLRAAFGGPA